MQKIIRKIAFSLGKLGLAIAIMYGLALWWFGRDIQHLREFCEDAKPGTKLAALPMLADKNTINKAKLAHGLYLTEQKNWLLTISSDKTMGDFACIITHNGMQIISSHMEEP